jgi:CheY-like chemotaxis protein
MYEHRRDFDLIVSDIGMPQMDGYEFIREVRARTHAGRRPAAIAVSAYVGAEEQRRAVTAGFDAHLAKPYTPDQLVAACATLSAGTM